jgi:acetyl/propionyl-CoA carboxylase alpha subunit
MKYIAEIEGRTIEITLENGRVEIGGKIFDCDVHQGGRAEHYSLILDGKSYQIWMEPVGRCMRVHLVGFDYEVCLEDERAHRLRQLAAPEIAAHDAGLITAPMPGLVVKILVEPGQQVAKGQGVILVEAMKMENEIRSPVAGVVKEVNVRPKQAVEKGEVLVVVG